MYRGGRNAGPLSARSSFSKQTHKDAAVAPFVGGTNTSRPIVHVQREKKNAPNPGGNRTAPVQHLVVLIGRPLPIGHSRAYRGPPDILIGQRRKTQSDVQLLQLLSKVRFEKLKNFAKFSLGSLLGHFEFIRSILESSSPPPLSGVPAT